MSKSTRSFLGLFWLLAAVGLAVDQGSKYLVFAALYNDGMGGRVTLVPNLFSLSVAYTPYEETGDGLLARLRTISGRHLPVVNKGALFGLGQGNNFLFAVISLAAAVAIVWWSTLGSAAADPWLSSALGLILAGTLGNCYDRIVFDGVRDFLHWYIDIDGQRVFDWPVFNIADCCLVVGAGLLVLHAAFFHSRKDTHGSSPAGTSKDANEAVPLH